MTGKNGNNSQTARVVLIVGFDRCGSSMIAGLLKEHGAVNMLFQPFNSTEVHHAQWEIWEPGMDAPSTRMFMESLLNGKMAADYINSDWFSNHSSSGDIDLGRLNIIKDTKLHFKTKWLQSAFPEIGFWGIWREPKAIVCSLMRNEFHRKWYGKVGAEKLREIIGMSGDLEGYHQFLEGPVEEYERMAIIVAVRTHIMLRDLKDDRLLVYEDILVDPNGKLGKFTSVYGLEPFDFKFHMTDDYNVIGKPFSGPDIWKDFFNPKEADRLDRIFEETVTLKTSRFG